MDKNTLDWLYEKWCKENGKGVSETQYPIEFVNHINSMCLFTLLKELSFKETERLGN